MAIQGKYRSDTASRIRCCIDIKGGMAVTWNLWPNLEGYRATQENTRVTLRRGSSVALTSKKEWPRLGICSHIWKAIWQSKEKTEADQVLH